MKYLFIFLIASSVSATTKVKVTVSGVLVNSNTTETLEAAKVWVKQNEKILKNKKYQNSFGKVERWLKKDHGNSIDSREITNTDVDGVDHTYTDYKYAQTYEVNYHDISDEINQKKADKIARKQEIDEIKALKDTINASDLPIWHKKLLKHIIKEIRND